MPKPVSGGAFNCSICNIIDTGFGNNPWPITEKGRCCDRCNERVVVPARIAGIRRELAKGRLWEPGQNEEGD
jgi:hypothetical protein